MHDEATIWLVGMMGSGKSTIGPLLARGLGCDFVDLDHEVERRAGRSISAIFAGDGEAAFRRMERECIDEVAGRAGVVALGGGAIAQPGMAQRLAETGRVVYLAATPEQLMQRLGRASRRPLLAGLDDGERLARLEQLLEERRAHYETAQICVDVAGRSSSAVAEELLEKLRPAR